MIPIGKILSLPILLALLLTSGMKAMASPGFQDTYTELQDPAVDYGNISMELDRYLKELTTIASGISRAKAPALSSLERKANEVNVRWTVFTQTQQYEISTSDALMERMSAFQVAYQVIQDSITSQRNRLEAARNFEESEKFLNKSAQEYEKFSAQAKEYTLTQTTAPLLERLKAQEQLYFSDVQKHYQKAKEAAALVPSLSKRMDALESEFITLQTKSENISKAEYVPLVQRLKDYILSIAGVAVILMFLSMIKNKISALKAAKENAEKYKSMMDTDNNEYPTI